MAAVRRFSALQRAEIAEIGIVGVVDDAPNDSFSALQRAEIAEILQRLQDDGVEAQFQCSSTSRNC